MRGTYCVELFSVEHRKFGIPGNISGTVCLLCLDPNHNKDLRTCKQATIPHIHIKPLLLILSNLKLPFSAQHISASKGNFAECRMTLNLVIGVKDLLKRRPCRLRTADCRLCRPCRLSVIFFNLYLNFLVKFFAVAIWPVTGQGF